jgi:hypothetical protein
MLAGFPKSPIKNLCGMFEYGQQGTLSSYNLYRSAIWGEGSIESSLQAANTLGCQDAHTRGKVGLRLRLGGRLSGMWEGAPDSLVSNSRTFLLSSLLLLFSLRHYFTPHSSTPYPAIIVTTFFFTR